MKQLMKFFDKMAEAESKSHGFFGKLFGGIKKLCKGDVNGAFKDLKEGFESNPFTAALFTAFCVFACVATAGMLLPVLVTGVLFFGPAAASDPDVQKMMADSFGTDQKTMAKWCMGVSISLSVILAILIGIATGGAGAPVALAIVAGMAVALTQGGIMAEAGVRSYQASKASSEGLSASADADRSQAKYGGLESDLKREMGYLQGVFDTISATTASVVEILKNQASGMKAAATI
jgi:hypothetical protein